MTIGIIKSRLVDVVSLIRGGDAVLDIRKTPISDISDIMRFCQIVRFENTKVFCDDIREDIFEIILDDGTKWKKSDLETMIKNMEEIKIIKRYEGRKFIRAIHEKIFITIDKVIIRDNR